MDFLKTLLAYMATTLVVAVESTSTPVVTPIPTPAPTASIVETAVRETATMIPVVTPSPEPTVSVTPAPVPLITPNTRGYHNLLQGDRGEEVRRLQEKLIELGYLPEGSADGAFGGQTRRAVRAFQYYNGLEVDGIAGRTTQTNLFENPDVARYPSESEATETPTVSPASPTAEDTEAAAETVTAAPAAAAEETAKPAEEKTEEPVEAPAETVTAAPAAAAEEAAKPAEEKTEEPAEAPAESAENAENATAEPAKESAEKQEESTAAETVVTVSAETAAAGPATALTEGTVTTEPAPAPAKEAAESVTAAPTEGSRTAIYILTEEAETPAQATAEPAKEAETPAQATAEPVKETEAPAQETAEPVKETEAPAQATAEPVKETEAPAQATAEPAKESEKPAGEETAAPEEKTSIEEKSEAPVAEMMEHVDLDLLEQTPVPQATATPEPVHYEDLAGWVVLNDSGESMQWRALEDGVPVVRSPRLQRQDEDIRVSLDDLCESVESWTLTGEGNSLILEAQGFVLALLQEDAGFVSTVDGLEMVTESRDFDFGEGHFIRVDFLTRALDGSWAWDAEEETLMLRIPQKNPALYTD